MATEDSDIIFLLVLDYLQYSASLLVQYYNTLVGVRDGHSEYKMSANYMGLVLRSQVTWTVLSAAERRYLRHRNDAKSKGGWADRLWDVLHKVGKDEKYPSGNLGTTPVFHAKHL